MKIKSLKEPIKEMSYSEFTMWLNENWEQLFISHDLTKEQEKITLEILRKYYPVEYNGDNYTCIIIKNKEEV